VSDIWNAIKDFVASGLNLLHDWMVPLFGADYAWGWAIIALTVVVRILLIPLAVKQFHSMKAMQELQPEIKAVQKKYKVDRSMMRSDPEKYRKLQAKKNEELQALYRENQVNPAAGCLPLLAQGPVFFALYSVLRDPETLGGELFNAPFYVFDSLGEVTSTAGVAGWVLIAAVAGSMFVSQKQMMGRNAASQGDAQATQQKVMLYAMPLMMGFFGFQLPVGVLIYWVTTNIWTMAQQAFIMREAKEEVEEERRAHVGAAGDGTVEGSAGNTRMAIEDTSSDNGSSPKGRSSGKSSQKKPSSKKPPPKKPPPKKPSRSEDTPSQSSSKDSGGTSRGSSKSRSSGNKSSGGSGHLPSRPSRRK
jgi:YidC/Oxa1 family membrane protein insertase